jgi:hypothetical protein
MLQRQRPGLAVRRQQAHDPAHPGRDQPPFQLTQHRAADPPAPPRRGQADPHHPGLIPGHRGHRHAGQFLPDHGHHGRLMRPDRRDQVGQPEQRRLAARCRVLPHPDRGIEVISVKITHPPHHHRNSVTPVVIGKPARTIDWSSAIRTRIVMTGTRPAEGTR